MTQPSPRSGICFRGFHRGRGSGYVPTFCVLCFTQTTTLHTTSMQPWVVLLLLAAGCICASAVEWSTPEFVESLVESQSSLPEHTQVRIKHIEQKHQLVLSGHWLLSLAPHSPIVLLKRTVHWDDQPRQQPVPAPRTPSSPARTLPPSVPATGRHSHHPCSDCWSRQSLPRD